MPYRKRLSDIILGGFLATITAPLLLILLIGSAVVFRCNPLFAQPRCGQNGKTFTFFKIRTLAPTAPSDVDKYELESLQINAWGAFLRHYHLDEIPQFWMAAIGSMSLVGPRPEMPRLAATFDQAFVTERQSVRPGCTGLWQISESAERLIGEAPEYDLHFVRHWTLRLDLWILMYTAREIFGTVDAIKDVGQVPTWTGASLVEPAFFNV